MFLFFQPQQHSHSHLILSHISYYEERRGTHEKEKRTFRQNESDATAETYFRPLPYNSRHFLSKIGYVYRFICSISSSGREELCISFK